MFDLYTTEELHDDHQCVFFNADEFASVGLPTDVELKQLSSYAFSRYSNGNLNTVTDCKTNEYSKILPFSTSPTTLKNKINSLQASGWTATHIGTRWGAALLERGAAPIANALGSPDAAGHPKDFNEPGVLKALIVMSDGNNTHHRRLKDGYRSGGSNIYTVTNGSDVDHFIKRDSDGKYLEVRYWGQPYNDFYPSNGFNSWINSLPNGTQKQLAWSETWDLMTISDYSQISGVNKNNIYGNVSSAADADAAMLATCAAAKANDQMVVYTIYFGDANTGNNGPSNAETLLSNCASGPGQFYNVTALDIEAAFSSIAISVQKLKLTQ